MRFVSIRMDPFNAEHLTGYPHFSKINLIFQWLLITLAIGLLLKRLRLVFSVRLRACFTHAEVRSLSWERGVSRYGAASRRWKYPRGYSFIFWLTNYVREELNGETELIHKQLRASRPFGVIPVCPPPPLPYPDCDSPPLAPATGARLMPSRHPLPLSRRLLHLNK